MHNPRASVVRKQGERVVTSRSRACYTRTSQSGLGTCDCVVLVAPGTSGLHAHDQCSLSRQYDKSNASEELALSTFCATSLSTP